MAKLLGDLFKTFKGLPTPAQVFIGFVLLGLIASGSLNLSNLTTPETVQDLESEPEAPLQSKTIKVEFLLYSSRNSRPISDANVQFIFSGAPEARRTDSSGYTSIEIPSRNQIEIFITKEGFNDTRQTINLVADTDKTVTYYLEPTEYDPPFQPEPEPEPEALFPKRQIDINIAATKPDGAKWDGPVGAAPDPAICITTQDSYTYCLPEGETTDSISESLCSNTYNCNTIGPIPDGDIALQLIDDDVKDNDTIGSGFCSAGQTCEIGSATITLYV